jgi:pimeloyl-ACP methyl ester carboxylesterase
MSTPEAEGKYVTIQGLRFHYLDWGGDGPALVCLHGAGGNARHWDGLAAALSGRLRVIALDQRGHGRTEAPPIDDEPAGLAEDLRGFADALGLEWFHLLGHSMGARAAIAFAGQHPHRLSRLVLSDPPHYPVEDTLALERAALQDMPERFPSRLEAATYLRQAAPPGQALSDAALEERVEAQLVQQPDGSLAWRVDPRGIVEAMTHLLGDMPLYLRHIACPTLVLRGTRSQLLSAKDARRLAATIPHATLREIDAGHGIWRDNPEAFLRAVREFLLGDGP